MIQVHTCVRIHCDQCGDPLGGLGSEEYHATETAALSAAEAVGWRLGPGGRLWCSACAPVLSCEAEGHQFTDWRHPRTQRGWLLGATEYRHCRRCCLHESRPAISPLADVAEVGEVA